ncbi:hypothetical protein CR513_44665, partial [Mucuna pruriens]
MNERTSKKAQTEKESCLRIGNYLKAADQEMSFRRAERDYALAKNQKEAIRDSKAKEEEWRGQLYLLQDKVNLLEKEIVRNWQHQEDLEVQRDQCLIELVEECRRAADWAC